MAVTLSLSYTLNSQSVANNTSNVTVTVKASWTGGSYNLLEKSGSLTIDGVVYAFTSSFNTGKTTSGSQTLHSRTVTIKHDSTTGSKTLYCSAKYTTGVSSGTISASFSKALPTILRASTVTASNGTLGTAQVLTVETNSSAFTHTITYECGGASGTICTKSSSTSISWTPPLSLASQNTTGTSVAVKFAITTYNGSQTVGTNTKSITCAIPSSVKPSCTVSVTDSTGYAQTYGKWIAGLSILNVVVTPTTSYGSPIASYSTMVNDAKYTTASFRVGTVTTAGTVTITATVTDKRGRSGSASVSVAVSKFVEPAIIKLTVKRCDSDGTENDQGNYVQATFSAEVESLNSKNTASYTLKYKKTTESTYTSVALSAYNNVYSVTDATYIFPADSGSSYNVELSVTDNFKTTKRATSASTAFTIMHWKSDGTAMAIGKIAEESNLFDVGLPARFNQPVSGKVLGLDRLPAIPSNSDLNDYMEPGCYAIQSNAVAETCANIPVARAGRLEVWSATGEGIRVEQWSYIRQRFIPYNSSNAVWERDITRSADNIWRYYDWWQSSLTPVASEKVYSKAAMTTALSANAVLGAVNTYTKIPFNKIVLSTSGRLTLESSAIRIGENIQYVKVSGQTLISPGSTNGLRHIRIQKVSEGYTTSIAWNTVYITASQHEMQTLTPIIVSVKEGDLLQAVFYTGNENDSISSGSAANGWQTYLTVEEL